MIGRRVLAVLVLVCVAALPSARAGEVEQSLTRDRARPAVGEWVGQVSWNEPRVRYSWAIFPDGTFSSGRLGRGHSGGGTWGMPGGTLVLKYADGFRYEGELRDDIYSGTAFTAGNRPLGSFSMSRAAENAAIEDAP